MHPFEFALAIVALVLIFRLIKLLVVQGKRQPHREERLDAELVQRLAELEERVKVLERIVTDERYDLKQQFKDLGA